VARTAIEGKGMEPTDAGRRRSTRFGRGGGKNGTWVPEESRLVTLERERAALELFAGVAAHELMAPLIAAETHARLLEQQARERFDGSESLDLHELLRVLSRMRLLVETLLHEARSSANPLERRPVSLQRLVEGAIELLAREIAARDARVIAAELPVVEGDEVLLGGVVNNLLLNALRYGPRNGGEVRIDARRARTHWQISVTSQGPTIPLEDRVRIFEPYHRGAHERRVAGAGLGLTICRSIVERHDGVIGVAPTAAGGNRFYFTLPADQLRA